MLELYHHGSSACAAKVRMVLAEKNLEWQGHYIDILNGEQFTPEYKKINPKCVVPTLVDDGLIIPESTVICEYLEEAYPDVAGLPADNKDRATSRLVARITDLYISPNFGPLLPHLNPASRDQSEVDRIAAELDKAFRSLAHYMGSGPFCVESEPTLGDCALGPYIKLLKNVVNPWETFNHKLIN